MMMPQFLSTIKLSSASHNAELPGLRQMLAQRVTRFSACPTPCHASHNVTFAGVLSTFFCVCTPGNEARHKGCKMYGTPCDEMHRRGSAL